MGIRFNLADRFEFKTSPSFVSLSADDRTAIAICDKTLLQLDIVNREQTELGSLPHPATGLSIDSKLQIAAVAAGKADVAIYDLESGDLRQKISRQGAPGSLATVAASHIALDPDGKMLVTTTSGSRIFVSNTESGQWEHIMFVKYDGCDVSISPDGRHVALFGSPKASEISGHLTLFRVHRGLQPLWTRWHDSDNAITSCRFSPDSKTLVTCGAGDGTRCWNSETGELRWHAQLEGSKPLQAAWSFGIDDHLATLGEELSITRKGNDKPVFEIPMPWLDRTYAISPSGKTLLTMSGKDSMSLWQLDDSNNLPE